MKICDLNQSMNIQLKLIHKPFQQLTNAENQELFNEYHALAKIHQDLRSKLDQI